MVIYVSASRLWHPIIWSKDNLGAAVQIFCRCAEHHSNTLSTDIALNSLWRPDPNSCEASETDFGPWVGVPGRTLSNNVGETFTLNYGTPCLSITVTSGSGVPMQWWGLPWPCAYLNSWSSHYCCPHSAACPFCSTHSYVADLATVSTNPSFLVLRFPGHFPLLWSVWSWAYGNNF